MALKIIAPAVWLDQVLEDFERSMLRRSLSPATVRTYRWALEDLFGGMKACGLTEITDLSREILEDWQDHMVEEKWRPRSRSLAVTAARQMIRWGDDRGLLDHRLEKALAHVKTPDARPRPIAKGDLETIKAYLLPRRPHILVGRLSAGPVADALTATS